MLKKINKLHILLTFLCLFFSNGSIAQLSVTSGPSFNLNTAINALEGQGVTISNASLTGSVEQIGTFTNGNQYIGFNDGVILTTGKASYASNINIIDEDGSYSDPITPVPNTTDVDLDQLSDFTPIAPVVLEFDIQTTANSLFFEFVFCSEEYLDYVGTNWNDVFGFFISGNWISGPFSNNAENIALVPNTNDIISINTVNDMKNTYFFINNTQSTGPGTFVYDGYTRTIQIQYPVQSFATYHLKFAISNINDSGFDSGIMLSNISDSPNQSEPPPDPPNPVSCSNCPNDLYLENRSPSNDPLRNKHIASNSITAGESVDPNQVDGIVNTGTYPVEFRANEISLQPGFYGKPGFRAIADPLACEAICNYCDNWNGFTVNIPPYFSPNGDGVNDVWYVHDQNNPFCAFNAQGYDLIIKNRWGSTLVNKSENYNEICPFVAPSPPINNIPYSSIYWDGKYNGQFVKDGVYYYILTLNGCGTQQTYTGDISIFDSPALTMNDSLNDNEYSNVLNKLTVSDPNNKLAKNINYVIYPNPTNTILNVETNIDYNQIRVYNIVGKEVMSINGKTPIVNVSSLESGIYFINLMSVNKEILKKI